MAWMRPPIFTMVNLNSRTMDAEYYWRGASVAHSERNDEPYRGAHRLRFLSPGIQPRERQEGGGAAGHCGCLE